MEQVIIYALSDGKVVMTIPTNEHSIEWVKQKDTPEGSIIFNRIDLPFDDFDFFDAWELNNGIVSVSLNKAKEVTKTRLREERIPLLQQQDILFQKALETNSDTSLIVLEKQRLRDITKLADFATTFNELRNIKV